MHGTARARGRSAGVAQPAGDPVDREQADAPEPVAAARRCAVAQAAQQLDLQERRAGRRTGCAGRSRPAAPARGRAAAPRRRSRSELGARALELGADQRPDPLARLLVLPQLDVAAGDRAGRPSRTPSRRWRAGRRRTASRAPSPAAARARRPRAPPRARCRARTTPGSTIRACVQEKTQGIARRSSMPPPGLRVGRPRAEPQPRDLVDRRHGGEEGVRSRGRRSTSAR